MTPTITKAALKAIIADMPIKYRMINFVTTRFGYVAYPRYFWSEAFGLENPWAKRLKGGAQ